MSSFTGVVSTRRNDVYGSQKSFFRRCCIVNVYKVTGVHVYLFIFFLWASLSTALFVRHATSGTLAQRTTSLYGTIHVARLIDTRTGGRPSCVVPKPVCVRAPNWLKTQLLVGCAKACGFATRRASDRFYRTRHARASVRLRGAMDWPRCRKDKGGERSRERRKECMDGLDGWMDG